jgi:hypothetical protein
VNYRRSTFNVYSTPADPGRRCTDTGSDGGDAGTVEFLATAEDTYLFMLVEGADPHVGPGERLVEGGGGNAGQNGGAGRGFPGGRHGNDLQETANLFQHTGSGSLRS